MKNNGRPTLRDVYEIVDRLEGKFDKQVEKMDERISVLERFKDKAMFVWAITCGIVAIGYDFVKGRFFRK